MVYGAEGRFEHKVTSIRNIAKSALLKIDKGSADVAYLRRQLLLIDKVADGIIEIGKHVEKETKEKFQDLDKELMRYV